MKNFFKGKVATAIILLATLVLAGVAIFTAIRLYQLRSQPVAPNVPSSQPHAQEATPTASPNSNVCSLSFTLSTPGPTQTPGPTETPGPTASPTVAPTATPAPQSTPNSCGGSCGSNSNCDASQGLMCYQGFCRNSSCVTNTNCVCAQAASTPAPVQPTLPNSGTSWPTVAGTGLGILVIIGSLLLAL